MKEQNKTTSYVAPAIDVIELHEDVITASGTKMNWKTEWNSQADFLNGITDEGGAE